MPDTDPSEKGASAGLRAALARAKERNAALLDLAPGGHCPLWYATLPTPTPDGRRLIGGWKTEESARLTLENLGYAVVIEAGGAGARRAAP
ncbi:MAG: hypothetical protein QM758_06650 [Armatimonas sp.]